MITPDELASIPDPVAGSSAAPIEERPLNPGAKPLPVAAAPTTTAAPPGAPEAAPSDTTALPEAATPQASPSPPPAAGSSAVWRVQVFASPDRAQAERVAREAAQKLGAPYVLMKDGDLVKVRLGGFTREEDAQALKERAVQSGYPGAFRVLDKGGS
ncbi:MAG TPA: SPOR domain-containing protein [Candidatus Eisenbacteria bacterium]|nr:SPOR domain-containing protein [Candidatus Eisenbacteria bacterium]